MWATSSDGISGEVVVPAVGPRQARTTIVKNNLDSKWVFLECLAEGRAPILEVEYPIMVVTGHHPMTGKTVYLTAQSGMGLNEKLPEQEMKLFREAKVREFETLLNSNALSVVSDEMETIKTTMADRIIPSRHMRTRKQQELSLARQKHDGSYLDTWIRTPWRWRDKQQAGDHGRDLCLQADSS